MEPSPVDALGGFHYFVVRLLEIVSEPGAWAQRIIYARARLCLSRPRLGLGNWSRSL